MPKLKLTYFDINGMDVIEDLDGQVFTQIQLTDEQKQTFREGLAEGAIKTTLVRLEEYLTKRGGEYMVDNRLTVADLKVFVGGAC